METKANTAVIGAFTLAVLAFAFGFIYWLAGADRGITKTDLTVVFSGPVAGLDVGSSVLFNGISIGDVRLLQFDSEDPSNVLARLSVNEETPIRVDSEVSLGFQGITGIAYVDISGGTPMADLLLKQDRRVMWAKKSAFEDLLAGARQILSRADTTLKTVEDVVTKNASSVEKTLGNIETFTTALADNSDQVSSFLQSISGAADAIADISGQLKGVVAKAETLLGDVDSAKVRETLDNIASASARLDKLVERGETILASVDPALVKQTAETIANTAGRLDGVVGRGEEILAAVDPEKVRQMVDSVSRVTGEIESFVKQGEAILDAVEPEKVRETVEGVASLSNTLTARQKEIDTIVTSLSTNLENAEEFTARLPDIGKKADEILAAVDPEKVNKSIDDVNRFTTKLGDASEDIDVIVANIKKVSEQASSVLAKIDNMAGGEGNEGLVADARETLKSIRLAADTFTQQAGSIGSGVNRFTNQGLRDLQSFVQEGRGAVSRLDRLITNLDRNPSQVIFGADNVPQYRGSGQRR